MCCAGSALRERDRGGCADGLVLPVVVGGLVERHLEGVRPLLVGTENPEIDRSRSQLRHRGERLVTRHADLELRQLRTGQTTQRDAGGADRIAQRHVRGDAAGVLDGEGLRLRLARLQVVEVEVEAAGGL